MQAQQPTFYWHDYETWGLNPALDRPSQFAGIRTDIDFNIIDEPEMFYCRLSDDYLPSPESALVTGITPEITQSEGLSESAFAQRIHQQFTQVNTCVVGYNSIRFDEEFTRNIFYRNFYDPYEYAWKNGNSRWDIIDLVRATYALRPEGIIWPKNEQGLPSFRLELLTEANGISHENAHDAMSDVYATIAVAKLIKQKVPKLFNYYFDLRNKNKVKALIDTKKISPLVHVSGMFGASRGNISLVAPVVWHPVNTNAVVVVDLQQDLSPLFDLSSDEIRERLYTKHDVLGEKLPIPLKMAHINKCPFLAIEKVLLPEDAERLGIDRKVCFDNLQLIKNTTTLATVITEVFQQEKKLDNKNNVDSMLYEGFFSDKDKRMFDKIRITAPEELGKMSVSTSDKRFKDLFFNYRARNFPELLSADEQKLWLRYRQSALLPISSEYFSNFDLVLEKIKKDGGRTKALKKLLKFSEGVTSGLT